MKKGEDALSQGLLSIKQQLMHLYCLTFDVDKKKAMTSGEFEEQASFETTIDENLGYHLTTYALLHNSDCYALIRVERMERGGTIKHQIVRQEMIDFLKSQTIEPQNGQ